MTPPETSNDPRQWIGRSADADDVVTAAPLAGLSATLDRDDLLPRPGDDVPPGGHWLYFLPHTPASELADDGHAKRGGFLPPVPLARRMWAGGRLQFQRPLTVGSPIRRVSEIIDVTEKEGALGRLVFVVVRHTVTGSEGVAVIEDHDIVYRDAPRPGAPTPKGKPPPGKAVWRRTVVPDEAMLFRYSALIFNAHRIHYDHPYVTGVEGYPGLVVHGPLTATLLMDLCRRQRPDARLTRFDYRALRPLFAGNPLTVAGEPAADGATAKLWALDGDGLVAMTAEAAFGD